MDSKDQLDQASKECLSSIMQGEFGIVLFDGVCNLCAGLVQFLIPRDPNHYLRFASLQSEVAKKLLGNQSETGSNLETVFYIENGRVYRRSSAVLRIFRRLRTPWPILFPLIIIPAPIRDFGYRLVARNRYRWFGQKESCWVPTPELQERFLEGASQR